MIRAIYSEWIKYKRTPIPWLIILSPFAIVLISAYYASLQPIDGNTWLAIFDNMNQIWSGAWVPFGWGLISGLATNIEKSSGNWRSLRVTDKSPGILFASKILLLVMLVLFSALLLVVFSYLAGQIIGISNEFPLKEFVVPMIVNWIAGLPILIISLWLAEVLGWGVSVGVGAIGILIASIIGGTTVGGDIWAFVPWSWPMKLTYIDYALITNTLPSSVPINTFWVVLLVAVVLSFVIAIASVWWFQRREVK
jgi:lantibiotic protection ABC transporter MutG family permease subunit